MAEFPRVIYASLKTKKKEESFDEIYSIWIN